VSRIVTIDIDGQYVEFDWGQPHELGSAAFWIDQTRQRPVPTDLRLGRTLREEVAACILGGYGLPASIGLAAFHAVVKEGLLDEGTVATASDLERVLSQPLEAGGRNGAVRYRFPRQRSARLAAALSYLANYAAPVGDMDIRRWLLDCPGVGPKTAAWVIRNLGLTDEVAIVDVHVHRAGVAAGFFLSSWRLPQHYRWFEDAFCAVASLGAVSPGALDACIWDVLQSLGSARSMLLGDPAMA